MTINKRRKTSRQRGSMSHGWGHKKKHRGAGNRGGKGMSGSGKRGDQKKPSIWTNKRYFGKHGFTRRGGKKPADIISIRMVEQTLDSLMAKGFAEKKGDSTNVFLEKAGFDKLVSQGKITGKLTIYIGEASQSAIEKVEQSGGKVVLKEKIEKPVAEKKETEKVKETAESEEDDKTEGEAEENEDVALTPE